MKLKSTNWKEILKVSLIVGVLAFLAVHSADYTNLSSFVSHEAFETTAYLGALVTTGLILHRKLDKNADWGILVGMIITWLVPLIIDLLLSLIPF